MVTLDTLRRGWAAARGDADREAAALADAVRHLPAAGQHGPQPPHLRRVWRDDVDAAAEARAVLDCLQRDPEGAHEALLDCTAIPGEPTALTTDWTFAPGPRDWIIPDWMPAGRVCLLTGEGGKGKSRLALQLAEAVAAGDPAWMEGGPLTALDEPAAAIIASWEDDAAEVRRRLGDNPKLLDGPALPPGTTSRGVERRERDLLDLRLQRRLCLADLSTAGALWGPADRGHVSTIGALTAAGDYLRGLAEASDARLLIIDPLAGAFASNENDRGLVRAFMASWDAWGRRHRCTVLIVAHPPKSAAAYSGSTDWHAASRAVWTMEEKDGATQLACIKSSYGPRPPKLRLTHWPWWRAEPWTGGDDAPAQPSWTAPPG